MEIGFLLCLVSFLQVIVKLIEEVNQRKSGNYFLYLREFSYQVVQVMAKNW